MFSEYIVVVFVVFFCVCVCVSVCVCSTDFKLLTFPNNTVKILNKWDLLKTCIKTIFVQFEPVFTMGKVDIDFV